MTRMTSATALLSHPAVIAAPVPVLPEAAAPKTRSRAAVTLARLLHHLSDRIAPAADGSPSACCGETLRPAPRVPGFLFCPGCGGMTLPAGTR